MQSTRAGRTSRRERYGRIGTIIRSRAKLSSPAPTDPAALVFLTMTTKPTFRTDFKPGEGGKIWGAAVSMARWINTRREGAVVGDCDGDGGGLKECREGCG